MRQESDRLLQLKPHNFWLIAGGIGGVLILGGCNKTHTTLKSLEPTSSARAYLAEFRGHSFKESSTKAPDGSAHIEVTTSGWLPISFFQTCHTLWTVMNDGSRQRILTAREEDPGSGRSFAWGWARDSKAVFVSGRHSGLDCRRGVSEDLNVIFTLADGTAWAIPVEHRLNR